MAIGIEDYIAVKETTSITIPRCGEGALLVELYTRGTNLDHSSNRIADSELTDRETRSNYFPSLSMEQSLYKV